MLSVSSIAPSSTAVEPTGVETHAMHLEDDDETVTVHVSL
jgi:hypothetical protein